LLDREERGEEVVISRYGRPVGRPVPNSSRSDYDHVAAVAACLDLCRETNSGIVDALRQVMTAGAWVPGLWRLEVANILEMGVRRGRRASSFRDLTRADLALLPMATDLETDQRAWNSTVQLAVRHQLTLHDAVFLELAMRRMLPLATLDKELRSAAATENTALLGL
jgi:predicted nucleic acid-binding protein